MLDKRYRADNTINEGVNGDVKSLINLAFTAQNRIYTVFWQGQLYRINNKCCFCRYQYVIILVVLKLKQSGEVMATKKNMSISVEYAGKYVATCSFNDSTVVASGKSPGAVRERAVRGGAKNPVVFFVPKKNSVHIY